MNRPERNRDIEEYLQAKGRESIEEYDKCWRSASLNWKMIEEITK
jgi:hypothetical protein